MQFGEIDNLLNSVTFEIYNLSKLIIYRIFIYSTKIYQLLKLTILRNKQILTRMHSDSHLNGLTWPMSDVHFTQRAIHGQSKCGYFSGVSISVTHRKSTGHHVSIAYCFNLYVTCYVIKYINENIFILNKCNYVLLITIY